MLGELKPFVQSNSTLIDEIKSDERKNSKEKPQKPIRINKIKRTPNTVAKQFKNVEV